MPIPKRHNAHSWYHSDEPAEGKGLISRNVAFGEIRSSIRLDAYTWDCVRDICDRENITPNEFYVLVAKEAPKGLSFTVALRRHVLAYYRARAKRR